MAVNLIDDKSLWDGFMDKSLYGTLFHRWDFLRIVEKHSGYKLYPYGVFRGDELVCLFPLFIKSHLGLKLVASPPPGMAIPHLGFVMSPVYDTLKQRRKETYINEVMDQIEEEIKKLRASYIHISTVSGFVDVRPFKWNGYNVQMFYSYVIDLKRPAEAIWEDFDKDLKQDVRDAEKLSLSTRRTDDLDGFYRIMQNGRGYKGSDWPTAGKEYLKDVRAAFPDNVGVDALYNGDKLVDMVAHYQYKKQSVVWMGCANPDRDIHSSEYMTWELIKRKKAEGMETLGFPGANVKQLCLLMSRFNAPLEYNFSVTKKTMAGSIAEGVYRSLGIRQLG